MNETITVRVHNLDHAQRNPETDLALIGRGKVLIIPNAAQAVAGKPLHWEVVIEIIQEREKVRFGRIIEVRERRTAEEQRAHDEGLVRLGDVFPIVPILDVETAEKMVVAAYMVADLPYPPHPVEGLAMLQKLGGVVAELADVTTTGRYADMLPRVADVEQWRVEQAIEKCQFSIYHLDRMSRLYAKTPAAVAWAGEIITGLRQRIITATVLREKVVQRLGEGWIPGRHTVRYGWTDYETIGGGHYTDNISDAGVGTDTIACLVHLDQVGRQPFRDEKKDVLTLTDEEWALMESRPDEYLLPTAFLKEWLDAKEARYLERVREDAGVRPYSIPAGEFRWGEILRRSAEGWIILGVNVQKDGSGIVSMDFGFGKFSNPAALINPRAIGNHERDYTCGDKWGRKWHESEIVQCVSSDEFVLLAKEEYEQLPEVWMRAKLEAVAETAYRELRKAQQDTGYHGELKEAIWDRVGPLASSPTRLSTNELIAWTRETQCLTEKVLRWRRELESVGENTPVFIEVAMRKGSSRYPRPDARIIAPDGRQWIVAHNAPVGTEVPGVFRVVNRESEGSGRGSSVTLRFSVATGVTAEVAQYGCDESSFDWALGRGGDGVEQLTLIPNDVPEDVFSAFHGDAERARRFMERVGALPEHKLSEHIILNCGRVAVKTHLEEVSEDPDFFGSADPNRVVGYIQDVYFYRTQPRVPAKSQPKQGKLGRSEDTLEAKVQTPAEPAKPASDAKLAALATMFGKK